MSRKSGMGSPSSNIPLLTALRRGVLTVEGQFVIGSNATYLGTIEDAGLKLPVVYKPARGERLLWDFPEGSLARREVAAFLVSTALGWNLVPPTIYRWDGPGGPGSVQLFIEHDTQYHYFNFRPEHRQWLRPVVLFDMIINNADRKGGHLLIDPNEHLWLIDHGVSFHVEDKLRTVVWDFAGETISPDLLEDMRRFAERLGQPEQRIYRLLSQLLSKMEVHAMHHRIEDLLKSKQYPTATNTRRLYPWPPV